MQHSKKLMFALVSAGLLATPLAHASYPQPQPPKPQPQPPKPQPQPPKHSCNDIHLKELDVKLTEHALKTTGELKGLKKYEDVKVALKAKAQAELKCMNGGYKFPKPHQPGDVTLKLVDWRKIDGDDIDYGQADFYFNTKLPPLACKHPFTPKLKELILESVTLVVEQRECKVRFECDHLWIPPNEWQDITYECERTVLAW